MNAGERELLLQTLHAILSLHRGKENAITSEELSQRLGDVDSLDSTPTTRALVREVMDRFNLPIVGCGTGYYVATEPQEVQEGQAYLDSRIEGILDRKALLDTAWEKRGSEFTEQHDLGTFTTEEESA